MNYSTVSIMQPFKLWNQTANDIQNEWELNVTIQYVILHNDVCPTQHQKISRNPYLVIDRTKLNLTLQA